MSWYLILLVFLALLGSASLAYQVYKMTELDAECRDLKHPRLWGHLFPQRTGQRRPAILLNRKESISLFYERN